MRRVVWFTANKLIGKYKVKKQKLINYKKKSILQLNIHFFHNMSSKFYFNVKSSSSRHFWNLFDIEFCSKTLIFEGKNYSNFNKNQVKLVWALDMYHSVNDTMTEAICLHFAQGFE